MPSSAKHLAEGCHSITPYLVVTVALKRLSPKSKHSARRD